MRGYSPDIRRHLWNACLGKQGPPTGIYFRVQTAAALCVLLRTANTLWASRMKADSLRSRLGLCVPSQTDTLGFQI